MKFRTNFSKLKKIRNIAFILIGSLILSSLILILNIYKYSALGANYIIGGMVLLVLMNLLAVLLMAHGKLHKTSRIIELVLVAILLLTTVFLNYYVIRINLSVNNAIVDTSKEIKEEVETSFVTYGSSTISSLEDIEGKKFGIIGNASFQEGNVLPQQKLTDEGIKVTFVEFETYNDLLLGLFGGDVDVISVPSNYYNMFINNEGYEEYLDNTNVIYTFTSTVTLAATDVDLNSKDITSDPFSILMIGNADGLSDALIVATFNPKTMTATMTSIARDSYVPIACYANQAKDKITHARGVSRDCTIQTVENLMDINIDYFVEVNFQAVVDIVDALDGLYLYSPVRFVGQDASSTRGNFTVWVDEGWQWMDGLQALAFARERHHMPNGDLDRQVHQQEVISAIIDRLMQTKDINKLVAVIDAAGTNAKTNIPISKLTGLASYIIQELNANTVKNNSILQIKTSRLTGYSSWAYNDDFQLPLYIYRPYQGSIDDNMAFIKNNLWIDFEPKNYTSFTFDINYPYFSPQYYQLTYDEAEVHDKLPDFMPSMASSSTPWTLSDVLAWSANRSWITLNIDEIWPGESGYNETYSYNQVISQSVKYGVKTANFSSLTVGVIKHELDCSIEENRTDAQCKNIVPNFVGMTLAQVQTWSTNNNFPVTVTKILETEAGYDKTKVGLISSQLEAAYTKLAKVGVSSLTVYTMDYPTVTLPVRTILSSSWTKTQMQTWMNANTYTTATYTYSTTDSTIPRDTVIAIKVNTVDVTADTVIRTDTARVTVVLSPGPHINTAPVAANRSISISLTTGLTSGVYSGSVSATDVDTTDTITYALVGTNSTPATGTLVFNTNGTFTYTPATGVVAGATDSFVFKANDGTIDSNSATVTITITN